MNRQEKFKIGNIVTVKNYQIPRVCCIKRLTKVIPIQQQKPITIGFPPLFTNFTISVLSPIAAIARIIKNLLKSLKGEKKEVETPIFVAMVVIREAKIK